MSDRDALIVVDDLVDQPEVYRAAALAQPYGDIQSGLVTFHGMAPIGRSPLAIWLETHVGLTPTYEAFRKSPAGQAEPSFIHQDRDMGDWTAILFLNPDPPDGDGTQFWRHRPTGSIRSTAETPDAFLAEWLAWQDRTLWEPWTMVAAQFNRLLLFPAPLFHSRAIDANWGSGDDARLIQLAFGTGALPCG